MNQGDLQDKDYFESYADPGVHRLMIGDHARTNAYRRAIEELVEPGCRVLDVGAGTGILAMFAARAGAEVWAVDDSGIIEVACELAHANGLSDRLHFVRGLAEQVELPGKFDIIISEWMGFFALAECMFQSVVAARDLHIASGGVMLPHRLRLNLVPVEDSHLHVDRGVGLWERPVHGLDFGPMLEHEFKNLITSAVDLPMSALLCPPVTLLELDCKEACAEDYFFDSEVGFEIERPGVLHGFGGWFEVDLSPHVTLSCAPGNAPTHWRQSFFPIRPKSVLAGDEVYVAMRARPKEFGDPRLPLYFIDTWTVRGGEEIQRAFYCHQASFE